MRAPRLVTTTARLPERVPRAALHEHAVKMAEGLYAKFGQVLPIWIVATYGDNRSDPVVNGYFNLVIETAWASPDEKYGMTEFMRDFVNDPDLGAYAYAFICEAWVTSEKKGSKYEELRKQGSPVAPGDRPKEERDDILMIVSFERDGDSALTRFLTHDRGGPGKNFLGPRTEMEGVGDDSRMCLFPAKKEKP